MKKQLAILGILVLLLISVLFGGCTDQVLEPKTEKEKFIGKWMNNSVFLTMDLLSDGNCTFWSYPGTWDLKDGKLVINTTSVGVPATYTYVYIFFNNYKTVKLIPTISTTGDGYVLNKQ